MLDINLIREKPDLVRKALRDRQDDPSPVDAILATGRQTPQPAERGGSAQSRAQLRLEGDRQAEGRRRPPVKDRSDARRGRQDRRAR